MATISSEGHIQSRHIASTPRSFAPVENVPGVSWRGILVGLWLTSTIILALSLVPGIEISLGNLPGDIGGGSSGGRVQLPIATITLIIVTLTGICYRISSFLSRL